MFYTSELKAGLWWIGCYILFPTVSTMKLASHPMLWRCNTRLCVILNL